MADARWPDKIGQLPTPNGRRASAILIFINTLTSIDQFHVGLFVIFIRYSYEVQIIFSETLRILYIQKYPERNGFGC